MLYTDLPLREHTFPVIAQISLTLLNEQRREFAEVQRKLDELLRRLQAGQPLTEPQTLSDAIRQGQVIVYGDVRESALLIGANNQVTLNAAQLDALRALLLSLHILSQLGAAPDAQTVAGILAD